MKIKLLGLIAVFTAALMASAVLESAEARRGHGGGRAHFYGGHRGIHYVPMYPRQFHRNYFYRGPSYVYSGVGYYGGGCAWLRHRALATGSRYWWHRYHACRSGIYY
jgi:hypothetical protein